MYKRSFFIVDETNIFQPLSKIIAYKSYSDDGFGDLQKKNEYICTYLETHFGKHF